MKTVGGAPSRSSNDRLNVSDDPLIAATEFGRSFNTARTEPRPARASQFRSAGSTSRCSLRSAMVKAIDGRAIVVAGGVVVKTMVACAVESDQKRVSIKEARWGGPGPREPSNGGLDGE